jgi:hypothetical protein
MTSAPEGANMSETHGFIPDATLAWTVLAVWLVVVLVYGFWRSRGEAPTDPIRASGPTD